MFAQAQTPDSLVVTAAVMGSLFFLMGAVVMVLTVVEKIKTLFFKKESPKPPVPRQERFVTHAEFTEMKAELLEKVQAVRAEMDVMKKDVLTRLVDLDKYSHEATHRLSDSQHQILLKMERLVVLDEMRRGVRPTPQGVDAGA